jgi:hypothetical protein
MLDSRELATVLAALRFWQRKGLDLGGMEQEIASDGGELTPLTDDEIDDLCRKLNGGEDDIAAGEAP